MHLNKGAHWQKLQWTPCFKVSHHPPSYWKAWSQHSKKTILILSLKFAFNTTSYLRFCSSEAYGWKSRRFRFITVAQHYNIISNAINKDHNFKDSASLRKVIACIIAHYRGVCWRPTTVRFSSEDKINICGWDQAMHGVPPGAAVAPTLSIHKLFSVLS